MPNIRLGNKNKYIWELKNKYIFTVFKLLVCGYVHIHAYAHRSQKGCQIFWSWRNRWLSSTRHGSTLPGLLFSAQTLSFLHAMSCEILHLLIEHGICLMWVELKYLASRVDVVVGICDDLSLFPNPHDTVRVPTPTCYHFISRHMHR